MTKVKQAINVREDFATMVDLKDREKEIVDEIENISRFKVSKLLWKSDYFGSGKIGAVNYLGTYDHKPAVLKIQGAKPEISEIEMIREFDKQNKSKIIRPPKIYWNQMWNEDKKYESFIMEAIEGDKIIEENKLANKDQVKYFFEIYREYKKNCVNRPWIEKPTETEDMTEMINRVWQLSLKIKPNYVHRKQSDLKLALEAGNVLGNFYSKVEKEFVHGHLSVNDFKKSADEIVVFSNLFWKWRMPFYDALFGYHWYIYALASIGGITKNLIQDQKQMWLKEVEQLAKNKHENQLILAARLERAFAGLVLDCLAYIDDKNPMAEYMMNMTRNEVDELIRKF